MVEPKFKFKAGLIMPGLVLALMYILYAVSLIVAPNAYAAADGKKIYEQRCILCHGVKGDGKGHVSILPRYEALGKIWTLHPRDFTTGSYKWRTTPSGCAPTDQDLIHIVEHGISRAYMPSNADLTSGEIKAVVEYIKTFSSREKEEAGDTSCAPIVVKKPAYVGSPESVAKGEKIWDKMKCFECHGKTGKGDGPKADTLKDDWGNQILPFDFTSCAGKRGVSSERTYAAYTTGIDGSGMPSYQDSLSEEDRWNLVSYTLKLQGKAH